MSAEAMADAWAEEINWWVESHTGRHRPVPLDWVNGLVGMPTRKLIATLSAAGMPGQVAGLAARLTEVTVTPAGTQDA